VRIAGLESTIQTGTSPAGVRPNGNPPPPRAGGWTQRGIAFSYSPFYALRGDRLWVTSSERPDLYLVNTRNRGVPSAGNLLSITRRTDARLVPVSTVRDKYEAWVVGLASKSDRFDPDAERARVRAMLDMLPRAHTVPLVDKMLPDVAGRVWIRDAAPLWEPDGPQQWTVYSADGRIAARAITPANLSVMHISSDHITGVVRDDMNVEYVVVHRIVRG
jgi:hypothetical protein